MTHTQPLEIPPGVSPQNTRELFQVDYARLAGQAQSWAAQHHIPPAETDRPRTALLIVDAQVDFCIAGQPLYVVGAEDDNQHLCEFIYRNLAHLTMIFATMDTHSPAQIFHPQFWVNKRNEHPAPMTPISVEDVLSGRWQVNPAMAPIVRMTEQALQEYALHYVRELEHGGRYTLMIWPYHCLLGSLGHALVPAVHEALWFHSIARHTRIGIEPKGENALTENYSVFRPEVMTTPSGQHIAHKNTRFVELLLHYDHILIAGQAESHCVAWTIEDLLAEMGTLGKTLVKKILLLEDCTSPVVVPGVCDFRKEVQRARTQFEAAGVHLIKSTDDPQSWLE